MSSYLSTDIRDFVSVVNTTLIDEVIVDNLLPIATTLNDTQANITSLLAQSSYINSTASIFSGLMIDLNTGM